MSRKNKRGGGVALYVKNNLSYQTMPEYSFSSLHYESLFIKTSAFVFKVFYRPPSASLQEFYSFLDNKLDMLPSDKKPVVIMGDLNINMLEQSPATNDFLNIISLYGFSNIIIEPTRVTSSSETLIDLCLTNCDELDPTSGVLLSDFSDHLSTFCFIQRSHAQIKTPKSSDTAMQIITQEKIEHFRNLVLNVGWNDCFCGVDPNLVYNMFIEKIIELYNCAFPKIALTKCKKTRKPWITSDLLKRIRARNHLFSRFIKTKDLSILEQYKKVRNQSRIHYYSRKFSEIYYDPQKTWRTVKELLQKPQTHVPVQMEIGGEVLSCEALANEMNKHFLASGNFDGTASGHFERCLEHRLSDTMFLCPTSPTEMGSLICSLRNNCSPGYDGIRAAPINAISDLICDVLCHIANLVLTTGIFPDKMKIARVVAFYQGRKANDLGSYVPL